MRAVRRHDIGSVFSNVGSGYGTQGGRLYAARGKNSEMPERVAKTGDSHPSDEEQLALDDADRVRDVGGERCDGKSLAASKHTCAVDWAHRVEQTRGETVTLTPFADARTATENDADRLLLTERLKKKKRGDFARKRQTSHQILTKQL